MLDLLDSLAENYCTMRIMGSGTLTLVGVSAQRGVGSIIGQYSPIDHLAAALIVHETGVAGWDEGFVETGLDSPRIWSGPGALLPPLLLHSVILLFYACLHSILLSVS